MRDVIFIAGPLCSQMSCSAAAPPHRTWGSKGPGGPDVKKHMFSVFSAQNIKTKQCFFYVFTITTNQNTIIKKRAFMLTDPKIYRSWLIGPENIAKLNVLLPRAASLESNRYGTIESTLELNECV